MPAHKHILLKLSGRALMGSDTSGINRSTTGRVVNNIAKIVKLDMQMAVVVGGGNIFYGTADDTAGADHVTADYMGMLATMMDTLALQDVVRHVNLGGRVQSVLYLDQVVKPCIRPYAAHQLEEGKIVIFATSAGNLSFTADTATASYGSGIGTEIMLKATKVDRVYAVDPKRDPSATHHTTITFNEATSRNLQVINAAASTLCHDQKLPIKVFPIQKPGTLRRMILGEDKGTLVRA